MQCDRSAAVIKTRGHLVFRATSALVTCLLAALPACAPDANRANQTAQQTGVPRADVASLRARQITLFEGVSDERLFVAAFRALGDLGFTIEDSVPRYGFLVGSRGADEPASESAAKFVMLLVGLAGGTLIYEDNDYYVRAIVTSRPVGARDAQLRVSFVRIVTTSNARGEFIERVEELTDPRLKEAFVAQVRERLARGA
jgi:hypothetical protein